MVSSLLVAIQSTASQDYLKRMVYGFKNSFKKAVKLKYIF